jgi:hypothetical protein
MPAHSFAGGDGAWAVSTSTGKKSDANLIRVI